MVIDSLTLLRLSNVPGVWKVEKWQWLFDMSLALVPEDPFICEVGQIPINDWVRRVQPSNSLFIFYCTLLFPRRLQMGNGRGPSSWQLTLHCFQKHWLTCPLKRLNPESLYRKFLNVRRRSQRIMVTQTLQCSREILVREAESHHLMRAKRKGLMKSQVAGPAVTWSAFKLLRTKIICVLRTLPANKVEAIHVPFALDSQVEWDRRASKERQSSCHRPCIFWSLQQHSFGENISYIEGCWMESKDQFVFLFHL